MNSSGGGPDPLDAFDPLVAQWFRSSFGRPSDIQVRVWRELASGSHILACAHTGSGKTLAAFLGALNALAVGEYPSGELSVLYISPLKALNSDIRRNLTEPLSAIRKLFFAEGRPFPPVSAAVRSGDTSPEERRAFQREPSEILATTPESLALLLNSPHSREVLTTVKLVVLDEIHALRPNKRGAFLMLQLERLVLLCGEFRRIALSATVADPAGTAEYVAGFRADGAPRRISVVRSDMEKRLTLKLRYPPAHSSEPGEADPDSVSRWAALADAFLEEIAKNRTTLVFVNSRRHAEKIAFLLNERAGEETAWAHHGSLSREVRNSVEERLKRGALKAVVATGSLELGIDIGSIDEVILAGTPGGAAAAVQRLGRAGHRLGAESRAVLFPLHPFDLLLGTAAAADVRDLRLEPESPPEAPLDVLAQVVLATTAMDDWTEEELFALVRRAAPFARLDRAEFGLVLDMLRGRFASARLPALEPRLDRSAPPGILRAKRSVLPLLYGSGGVISDRGSFQLLLAENNSPLGELDEEFVWERRIGDSFSLGTRAWRIVGIDDRSVLVVPSDRGIQILPFWRAESLWRSEPSMRTVLSLLDEFDATGNIAAELGLDGECSAALLEFLRRQRLACPLPLTRRVVVEDFAGPGGQGRYAFLHTLRGGRLNAALGIALRSAADRRYGSGAVEFFWEDAGVLASFSAAEDLDLRGSDVFPALLDDVVSGGFSVLLAETLESTGLFGAAFRENSGRALLLPKGGFGKRLPLWMTRLRSKRLYDAVRGFPDFPIVRETWRSCLKEILDPDGASVLAGELVSGRTELLCSSSTAPSPFARGSLWIASDSFMYRRDEGGGESTADEELIGRLLSSDTDAPQVSSAILESVMSRVKRLHPDYLPRDEAELADWLDERQLIDDDEWGLLLSASKFPEPECASDRFVFPGASQKFVLSPDFKRHREEGFDVKEQVSRWMRYAGPVAEERTLSLFGPAGADALRELRDDRSLVPIRLDGEELFWCDAELASRLLRTQRSAKRSERAGTGDLPLGLLQDIAAGRQGLMDGFGEEASGDADRSVERLRFALEPLLGVSAPVGLWERDIFPARTAYLPYHLELLMDRFPLLWYGSGEQRVGFSLDGELQYADIPQTPDRGYVSEAERLLAKLRPDSSGWNENDRTLLSGFVRAGLLTSEHFSSALRVCAPREPADRGTSPPYGSPRSRGSFPSRDRWERARRMSGVAAERWNLIDRPHEGDALDKEEAMRERARRLVARYGLACRSLAALEEGSPPWPALFRALRMMEFSGEVVGGRFFAGLDELQFRFAADASADASAVSSEVLYCFCARDPASLCGLQPLSAGLGLPPRLASNHLVWRGGGPLLVSRRNGKEIHFRVAPDDPAAAAALDLLRYRLSGRAVKPVQPFTVERIGDLDARRSPYAPLLASLGFVESLKGLAFFSPSL